MLVPKIIKDILGNEENLIEYCKTLVNTVPSDRDDASDIITEYIKTVDTYKLLQLSVARHIEISNDRLVILLVQEINTYEMDGSTEYTSRLIKFIVEMFKISVDTEDLLHRLLVTANDEKLISSCFC